MVSHLSQIVVKVRPQYFTLMVDDIQLKTNARDRESTDRCPTSGRPQTATDDVHEDMLVDLMGESRSWTVDQLATEMGISYGSSWLRCYDPLTDQQAQEWRQPGEDPAISMFFIASKDPSKENALQHEIY
ncbi:unnamed protein product [Oppiella nova]|uniref:Uncharacterized protein n=1 Tax=Oppiella nova TaxID=334625 RepID=A0A7R9M2L4_9ACAR|nr:unnamed protein product [Oppiella nova]CAG2169611.1 unnamed protein product [Oppiella nova]